MVCVCKPGVCVWSPGTHVVVMISSLVLRISSTGPWNLRNRAAGRRAQREPGHHWRQEGAGSDWPWGPLWSQA